MTRCTQPRPAAPTSGPPPSQRPSLAPRVWQAIALVVLTFPLFAGESTNDPAPPSSPNPTTSLVLEAAGNVEFARAGESRWLAATRGLLLAPGDRLRTGANSRAALLLSDRSVIRINQHTIVQLQTPTSAPAKHRFRLNLGSLFFFDRDTPRAVEFETPLTTGAIRGTEFALTVDPSDSSTRLAMLDGEVDLTTEHGSLNLQTGDLVEITPSTPPHKSPLLNAVSQIQWALYYPAVLDPDELSSGIDPSPPLQAVLDLYRRGSLLEALHGVPPESLNPTSPSLRALLAALRLAVGNVDASLQLIGELPANDPRRRALLTLIAAVRQNSLPDPQPPRTASEWLARSYHDQSRSDLPSALAAAQNAVRQSPGFGFAHARVAELQLSFGRWQDARDELDRARDLSPNNAMVPTLQGFIHLDHRHPLPALAAFDEALSADASLGLAWLGRGLACRQLGRHQEAETALQLAAALEPQRSVYRSSLARVHADGGAEAQANRELDLAARLDPADPTPWLYRALLDHQQNRLNDAIVQLERSRSLNDRRSVFRSRLLLDQDQAVRSADLAALYADAGLTEVGQRSASRAVLEDYSGFSGHLFLANSYQQLDDPYRADLRLESARQSELLLANLLAPAGGGNLSQLLSQQDHLRLLEPRTVGLSSLTEYASRGDWLQSGSMFGTLGEFSYAVDTQYRDLQGEWDNQDLEEFYLSAQVRDQVTLNDAVYLQVGTLNLESGDTARRRSPEDVNRDLRVDERQRPFVYAGWNHAWSPGSHTLLLGAYFEDRVELTDPDLELPFVHISGGQPLRIRSAPLFAYDSESAYRLGSAELQQIWQTEVRTLVLGGRAQVGDLTAQSVLSRSVTGPIDQQHLAPGFSRLSAYAYHDWQLLPSFRFTAGLSYDHLAYPANVDLPPITDATDSREQWSPKLGLVWTPTLRTEARASYAQSLGGLFFDNSVRLEPTQVAGWNQAFRSLIPESVVGQVPGSRFETLGVSLDQSFATRTYAGLYAEWLQSDGDRTVGVLTNATILAIPDSPSSLPQSLNYNERSVGGYLHQMLGPQVTAGARYRFSQAQLETTLPTLPRGLAGLNAFEQDDDARLHRVQLDARWFHPCGAFAQWRSEFLHQETELSGLTGPTEDFWLHQVLIGYRFDRRRAELVLGILNLTDTDFRLAPLNLLPALPHHRTFTASLRLNF